MPDTLLLIDFENVQKVDLTLVPHDVRVQVFYGVTQKKMPEELVVQAQPFGARLQWIKIAGQGPNALDFHIAFYVGRELAERPATRCVILSADQGFDPLLRHIEAKGQCCLRVSTLRAAFPANDRPAAAAPRVAAPRVAVPRVAGPRAAAPRAPRPTANSVDPFSRALTLLRKEKSLPGKRKGLDGKVRSYFPKADPHLTAGLLQRLFDDGHVIELVGGPLKYQL